MTHLNHTIVKVNGRLLMIVGIWLAGFSSSYLRAESASGAPATQETPQEAVARMSDGHLAQSTVDQAMSIYNVTSNTDREMAKTMAEQAIVTTKLEEAVFTKWGNNAKTLVAHACSDNTAEDDAQATWLIQNDRAAARFKSHDIGPLLLIRVDGKWRIDVAAYVSGLGNDLPAGLKFMKASTAMLESTYQELTQDHAFHDADGLVNHLKTEYDKLNAAN